MQRKLPQPSFHLDELNSMFASHGLTQTDMIALSGTNDIVLILQLQGCQTSISINFTWCDLFAGAHTIGFSHCSKFARRIYKFSRGSPIDPTLNPSYAKQLQQMCPPNVDPRIAIDMDPTTPQTFDNAYFTNLQQGMGLFTSDQALFTDSSSRDTVNLFAANNTAFQQAFITAITKLGRVGVKTGNQGEIRRDCTAVN